VVLPALRDFCLFGGGGGGVGTEKNCNFSAARSPIELKLVGDLRLVSQITRLACMFWFQDLIVFHIVNKLSKKNRNREKHGFKKLEFSPPFQVRLI
jgi:hypothetical protein